MTHHHIIHRYPNVLTQEKIEEDVEAEQRN